MVQSEKIIEAYSYCDEFARNKARNFYPAFRFLTQPRRLALSAFYTYCSLSDDIADDDQSAPVDEKNKKLNDWRADLERCFDGQSEEPLFIALQDAIDRFDLPREPFFDLLDGIEMDLTRRRYETFAELEIYCHRVASTVGLISVRIFGCSNSGADDYARNLGIAFQLTNVMRDISEDLARDRVYLPLEDLDHYSYSVEDLKSHTYDHRFLDLMAFQYDRAAGYFDQARLPMAGDEAKYLLTSEIMRSVYRRVLDGIRRRRYNVFKRRHSVPRWRVFGGIVRTLGRFYLLGQRW